MSRDIVPKSKNSISFQKSKSKIVLIRSKIVSHHIVSEVIPTKSVKINKEITVVTKIALTIALGFTSYAAQSAKENAPHGPSDTKNVPKNSFG